MANLWLGNECSPRDDEALVDGAEILSHDGQTTSLFAAGAGRQPLGEEKRSFCKL